MFRAFGVRLRVVRGGYGRSGRASTRQDDRIRRGTAEAESAGLLVFCVYANRTSAGDPGSRQGLPADAGEERATSFAFGTGRAANGAPLEKKAPGSQPLTAKAIPVLIEASDKKGVEAAFANDQLQNVRQCRSLPDHILRGIVMAKKHGLLKLQNYLMKLEETIGGKCSPTPHATDDDAVIVAIDHRVI